MLQLDLETFKTKKCELAHTDKPLSAMRLDCPHYHSREDKRRNPFASRSVLLYSHIYVEDFYSTQMASNMVEYLFHPNVYKTIHCKNRLKYNFQHGEDANECRYQCCPYIHDGEDLSYLQEYRNLPLSLPLQDSFCQKVQPCSTLTALLKNQVSQECFRDAIDKFKLRLREVAKQTEELMDNQQKAFATVVTQQKQTQIYKAAEQKEQVNWYHQYQYFHFGERLPVIEDRHHEFKNYRDIVNKDIAPIVVKYIAAFLNSAGGVLYVGIDDNSVVYGFQMTQHEFDRFLLNVDAEGKRSLLPPLLPHKYSVRRIPVYNNKKGKELWVVEIKVTPTEKHKKQKVLTTYNREIFIRMNASTQKLDAVDLIEYIRYHQEQKEEERKPVEIVEELARNLEKRDKTPTQQELLEIKEKLVKAAQKVEELLGRRKESD